MTAQWTVEEVKAANKKVMDGARAALAERKAELDTAREQLAKVADLIREAEAQIAAQHAIVIKLSVPAALGDAAAKKAMDSASQVLSAMDSSRAQLVTAQDELRRQVARTEDDFFTQRGIVSTLGCTHPE